MGNRDVFRDHFDYEEKQFMECGEPCDADAHKLKHDIFSKTLTWVTNPVSTEYMDFAMNWLAQHIKNTDFKYKYKLKTRHTTPEPYVWNKEFEVHYPRLDEEHVNLFKAMYNVENDLTNQDKVDHLMKRESTSTTRRPSSAMPTTCHGTTARSTRRSTVTSVRGSSGCTLPLTWARSSGPRTGLPSISRTPTLATRDP